MTGTGGLLATVFVGGRDRRDVHGQFVVGKIRAGQFEGFGSVSSSSCVARGES